jgi:hypothetical protein
MIHFPIDPSTGDQYVGTNGVTYTWMGDRWNSVNAIQNNTASYFVEGGDAGFNYNSSRDGVLDGGDYSGLPSLEININSIVNIPNGPHYVNYTLVNFTGQGYTEQGIIVSTPGHCTYEETGEYCDAAGDYGYRFALRTHSSYADFDCSDNIVDTVVDGIYSQAYPQYYFSNQTVNVRAYVKVGQTVLYSPIRTITVSYAPCFVAGTQITLADGSKKAIEHITYDDELRVWDFDAGKHSSARPLWIKRPQTMPHYNLSRFDDGTELGTLQVIKGHRVFCADTNQFEFVGLLPVGSTVVKDNGAMTRLVGVEHAAGMVTYYNVITDYHMNLYANDVLTSTGFNNLYPVHDMKFIKEHREPRTYSGIGQHWISGLRLAENTTTDVADMARHLTMLDSLGQGK